MAGYMSDVEVQQAARGALRPSESLKVALIAQSLADDEQAVAGEVHKRMSVFAVVSHVEEEEEDSSSIFVFQYKHIKDSMKECFSVISTYPITRDLAVSMQQTRPRTQTLDLRTSSTRISAVARANMNVTVQTCGKRIAFMAQPSQALSTFVAECKKAQVNARYGANAQYRWLEYYAKHATKRSSIPYYPRPDLRTLKKPIYSRLSSDAAGRTDNEESDIQVIRDEWIQTSLWGHTREHSTMSTVSLRIGTFNVNGKLPTQDLTQWIRPRKRPSLPPLRRISPLVIPHVGKEQQNFIPGEKTKEEIWVEGEDPDMLVLGFQELDLSAEALLYSTATTREDAWVEAVFAALGEVRDGYVKLASKQLVGMLVVIIVKKSLVQDISEIKSAAVGTGIMGMMGNKGATAIRLNLHSTVITFVNGHLPAYDTGTERRNMDYQYISQRLGFGSNNNNGNFGDIGTSASAASQANVPASPAVNGLVLGKIYESDMLFWLGDFNYRIDLPDPDVRDLLAGEPRDLNIQDLLNYDQLRNAIRTNKAFEGFEEAEIRHLPTYRFGAGLLADSLGYDVKRRPAWTDRILYMTSDPAQVSQLSYTGHEDIIMSDHKPVSADFTIQVRHLDMKAYHRASKHLLHRLGDFEDSEYTPQMKIKSPLIDLGEVRYKCEVVRQLELENTGPIACAFRFVAAVEDSPIHPSWLQIEPPTGVILSGDKVQLTFKVFIDDKAATLLNTKPRDLEQVLIIHVEHGKDHFIPISGQYRPTCFANSLATLIRLPGPIRKPESTQLLPLDKALSIPREYGRLIGWLMENGTHASDIFVSPGDSDVVNTIRECLDTGDEFPAKIMESGHAAVTLSFGQVLLEFLASLNPPIIPPELHESCAQATDRDEAFEVLSNLHGAAVNVWISLTAMLHFFCRQSLQREVATLVTENNRTELLSAIFAPILLPDDPDTLAVARISPRAKRNFLLAFIQ